MYYQKNGGTSADVVTRAYYNDKIVFDINGSLNSGDIKLVGTPNSNGVIYFNRSGNSVQTSDIVVNFNFNDDGIAYVNFPSNFNGKFSFGNQNNTNLKEFYIINTPNKSVSSVWSLFEGCTNLTTVDIGLLFDRSLVVMQGLFYNCKNLTSITLTDGFMRATYTSYMFFGCNKLPSIDLSFLQTTNVKDMNNMFTACNGLTSLDLSNFDTSNVTNMGYMFYVCSKLTHIRCKQAFYDWCMKNTDTIKLPTAMKSGGTGTWEIID